jgi:molybdate transport system ATP-binding protein
VLIARVLLAAPQVLVLDEPFDGLDLPARENLAAMVAALMNDAGAVILVTHRLSQVPAQVTHVMGIRAGRVLFQGLRAETLTPENIAELYGKAPLAPAAAPRAEPCPPIPREPLVEFRNVTVSYGGKPVLKNLTWSMRAGEHWALCGPNGSGKTTVVNLIAGENPQVYASDVRLFGRRRGSGDSIHDVRRRLGFMSCEFHLRHTRRLTAFEVVLSGFFDSVGLYRTANARQAESGRGLMESLGIGGLTGRAFPHLSFGEQRMVLLARAVVKLPELLVLDEPCQGLDRVNRRRVIEMVDRICRLSATHIIYVTHQPDEIPSCITHRLALAPGDAGARAAFSARIG